MSDRSVAPTRGVALVTGARGYVGGRLVPELLAAGWTVKAMARSQDRLRSAPWYDAVVPVAADVRDGRSLAAAFEGVDVAYYLIHSIGAAGSFEEADRDAAQQFAQAAADAGARRIVYLGGLQPEGEALSPHLRSRAEVGRIFLDAPVPAVVLQAAVVLGSGSASFEMMRYLTERLPMMVVPKWVDTKIQPIAIADVLHYLVGAAAIDAELNRTFDIGGPDIMTYAQMMDAYAGIAGLRRRPKLRVPVLTTELSSLWIGLVTPVPSGLARPLVTSLRNTVVCHEHDIDRWVPPPADGPTSFRSAVEQALDQACAADVASHWPEATLRGAPSDPMTTDPGWAGGDMFVDDRTTAVDAAPADLWRVIESIGGASGWYSWPLAWTVRGLADRLLGGPGLRRHRRRPGELRPGDVVDWWRVEHVVPGRLLCLRAEMRLPGQAWLDLAVVTGDDGATRFHQRAVFVPRGLLGYAYWWAMRPFHGFVFGQMQRNIAAAALAASRARGVSRSSARPPRPAVLAARSSRSR